MSDSGRECGQNTDEAIRERNIRSAPVDRIVTSPQTVTLEVPLLKRLIQVCEFAVDNTEECLNQLNIDADTTVKKHRVLAETYAKELATAESTLKELRTINGW